MTQARPPTLAAAKQEMPIHEIEWAIKRIGDRIKELEEFDIEIVTKSTPALKALSAAIAGTLERAFGENSSAYHRYAQAAVLQHVSMAISIEGHRRHVDYQTPTQENIIRSIALMRAAQSSLKEDLEFRQASLEYDHLVIVDDAQRVLSRRIFLVHGHDEGARETVARFLMQLGFDPIILHEQANRGGTVIEKIEAHGQVDFAVVLLTPDDEGCTKGATAEPRARQNVLLELGYFLGRLGRNRVCALKRGTLEIPSDFAGVVWESMDGNNWKQALGRELEAAGHEIDWNKVMRA
ncbi:TIR domain-containing protein [Pseudomonas coleopterorum]|uniref:TIR domain-containing protein n=1 Tax=Pseudomonas coleopterorum TaxID=1605838 RepID=UPI0017873248|nr:nucleotide-binding protein [Pseudomonas coleopterorum]MBD8483348.1 nucleotide-binding protein [Pseudomonas coleopterorum]